MSQLFNKTSSSANEMAEIWDDTALIRMYEESISSAYKSVAPAANKKTTAGTGAGTGKKKSSKWSVGGRCAAPYNEEDGEDPLWYPATITHIDVSSGTAEVCFDGYEGAETVALEELYPEEDLDGGPQQQQEEEEEEQSGTGEEGMEVSFHRQSQSLHQSAPFSSSSLTTSAQTPSSSSSRKRTNGGGKTGGGGGTGGRTAGGFRAPIPSLAPPPPPSFAALPRASEDDALSSMLMSWYMSGYHTGYYQAMQDLKAGKK